MRTVATSSMILLVRTLSISREQNEDHISPALYRAFTFFLTRRQQVPTLFLTGPKSNMTFKRLGESPGLRRRG